MGLLWLWTSCFPIYLAKFWRNTYFEEYLSTTASVYWYYEINKWKEYIVVVNEKQSPGGVRKTVLRNFAKFTGKHLCQSLFLNKVAGLRHMYIPVNFAKFLRTSFLTEHLLTTASVAVKDLYGKLELDFKS